jgi:hypothetical protein
LPAIQEVGVDETPHVPQLREDVPAGGMNRVGHRLPALDLGGIPQARRKGPAEPFAADPCRFADDQTGAGALGVIIGNDRRRHAIAGRPAAGERRHDDAVGRTHGAELDGIEQAWHRQVLFQIAKPPSTSIAAPVM